MSRKPRDTECLTLRIAPEINRQFDAVVATRAGMPKNLAFERIVERLYRAILRKLDQEGVDLLKRGQLDQSAWREQRLRYQRRKTKINCLTEIVVP
jgi:hypothetical protein